MMTSHLDPKALLLSLFVGLSITLFSGCFANAPANMDASFEGKDWSYLNRGYPVPWSGVGIADSGVSFPLIEVPFLSADDGRGTKLVKIIDLARFVPTFAVIVLISYFPSIIFAKAVDEHKKLWPLFLLANGAAVAAGIFVYFRWFLRV